MEIVLLEDLLEITGIIARYNVMENLYNTADTGLEINSKYQHQLIDLCVVIFTYFDFALFLAHGGNTELHESRYSTLLTQIRNIDKEAKGFRILISLDFNEEQESDDTNDESEEAEDEDWEQIEGVSRTNSDIISGTFN